VAQAARVRIARLAVERREVAAEQRHRRRQRLPAGQRGPEFLVHRQHGGARKFLHAAQHGLAFRIEQQPDGDRRSHDHGQENDGGQQGQMRAHSHGFR